jgi:conjugal transfer pilin signal peptidase TrbI
MKPTSDNIRSAFSALLADTRRLWYVVLPVFGIWVLAYTRLFVDPTPRIPVLFNWTPSIPCRVAWLMYAPSRLQRGDYVVFAFDGEAQAHYPGLRGQPFFKVVRGLPGDTVSVSGRVVSINDEVVGFAKTHSHDRRQLEPIASMVIPAGHYYVQGTSPDSFDSRYRASGLVRADQLIGTAIPLW